MNNIQELEQAKFLSVSALNRYLAYRFDRDENLDNVYLEGEISNFKISGRNLYFSLKDNDSEISAIMFYNNARDLNFAPEDGMLVQAVGKVAVYEKRGTYSINIRMMIIKGVGLLYQQFLNLKEQLGKEGLFDEAHKLPIPLYPNNIGVITSATGEAINDITSTLKKRYPLAKVVLYPALVQGLDAPKDLIRALHLAYQNDELDLIIIGRGGGSFEDLACFNDEELARTLYQAKIPTISAVGHEGDYTIIDFVASLRAATPTAAALLATRDKNDIQMDIDNLEQMLKSNLRSLFNQKELQINYLANSYVLSNFQSRLDNYQHLLDKTISRLREHSPKHLLEEKSLKINNCEQLLTKNLHLVINQYIELNKQNNLKLNNLYHNYLNNIDNYYHHLNQKLIILNPLNLMEKGYAIVYQDSQIITKINDLDKEQNIDIYLSDGMIKANILEIKEKNNGK